MKTLCTVVFLWFGAVCAAVAQSVTVQPPEPTPPNRNTADYIIDGGQLILEIVKEVKGKQTKDAPKVLDTNNIDDCWKHRIADLCFENQTAMNLNISFVQKIDAQNYSDKVQALYVGKGEKECNFVLPAGVYKYLVRTTQDGKTSTERQGEITLEPCEQKLKIIK